MRKWIVDGEKNPYKIIASYNQPDKAYCEAPDFFTRDMESSIILGQDVDGEIVPVLSDSYYSDLNTMALHKENVRLLEKESLKRAMLEAEERRKFNALPKWRKFFHSIWR